MRILFLDLDTLRPDHLGCYGYHRNTSPNIDSIAREGVRFNRYYCPNAPCLPSRASLVTGLYGIANGIVGHDRRTAELRHENDARSFRSPVSQNSLFAVMKKAGLHTASINTFADRHSAWWFNAGLNEHVNVDGGGGEPAERVTPAALDWIERNAERDNWALHINYWDPHTPYRTPLDYNPFENDPLPEWYTQEVMDKHKVMASPHGINEIAMWDDSTNPAYPKHLGKLNDMDDFRKFIDGYDSGIRYMDDHIGMLFDALRRKGVFDDLCVIITSDHGENLGELGLYAEHATADDITCRIPMIVKWTGGAKGLADDSLRANVDLLPTLADLFEQQPFPRWDGLSFAEVVKGKTPAESRDCVVLTQGAHVVQRSVRFGKYLYMRTIHGGYHLFDEEMLFDIERDPHEQRNIAAEHPELCLQAMGMIANWQYAEMKKHKIDTDPLFTTYIDMPCHCRGQLPAYIERLKKTGRGAAAKALAERYKDELM